jgi:hypothetical protein
MLVAEYDPAMVSTASLSFRSVLELVKKKAMAPSGWMLSSPSGPFGGEEKFPVSVTKTEPLPP